MAISARRIRSLQILLFRRLAKRERRNLLLACSIDAAGDNISSIVAARLVGIANAGAFKGKCSVHERAVHHLAQSAAVGPGFYKRLL